MSHAALTLKGKYTDKSSQPPGPYPFWFIIIHTGRSSMPRGTHAAAPYREVGLEPLDG